MNIDLRFQDWSITLSGSGVRQYDDNAHTVRVTGDLPALWRWRLDVAVYGETYFNSIPLTESDGALSAVLTRDDLAFGDTVYTLQLVGEQGDVTRHTNPVRQYVGASLSGDGVWPELPRAFTDAVHTAQSAAERAVSERSAALQELDALADFRETEGGSVPQFTNVIPSSVDTDGTPYQSGIGYLDGYRIKSGGTLEQTSDAFVTGFIPLPANPGNMVLRFADARLIASGSSTNSRIQFYDASFASLSGGQTGQGTLVVAETDSDGYITRINIADQTAAQFIPSANARYFRFSAYGSGANAVCTINEEIRYAEGGTTLSAALKPDVTIPQLSPLDARVTALETAAPDPADPLVKYAAQLDRARTFGYAPMLSGRPTQPLVAWPTLNFLHISDTHGSPNVQNAVAVLNQLHADGRCAFLIHTGDMHASTFASDFTAFQGYIDAAEAPFMMVAGNHDVGNNSKSTLDGSTAMDEQLYDRVFAPNIDGWQLTDHPQGKCYWYKDFPDNAVRLIGLYDFESDYAGNGYGELLHKRGYAAYHQAQIDWLIQALLTCPEDYGVIIAKHNPVNLRGALDNPFNGEYLRGQNTAQTCVSSDMIPRIVQAFMDGETIDAAFAQTGNVTDTLSVQQDFSGKNPGAHFICYLDGHTHADGVSFLQDFPRQLELNIGCDNFHYQHYADTLNESGTLHQDLMNYVSVDVSRGYVYIQRIGNDFTPQADRRDFTAIDYRHPPEAADLAALSSRVAALENPPQLELINTVTFDGESALNITTDSAGAPLRLTRAILRITMGTVAAASSITVDAKYANVVVGRWYSSLSAATGHRGMFSVWQDGSFWDSQFTSISKNVGTVSKQPEYTLRSVQPYPYIEKFVSVAVPPSGTVLEVYGVRA